MRREAARPIAPALMSRQNWCATLNFVSFVSFVVE